MRASCALFAAFLAAAICTAQAPPAKQPPLRAEIVFFNGIIYTGVGLAEGKPQTVEAMAVGGGKILAVGSNDAITRLARPKTVLRD